MEIVIYDEIQRVVKSLKKKSVQRSISILVLWIALFLFRLSDLIFIDFQFFLTILSLPFLVRKVGGKGNLRFGWVAAILFSTYFVIPITSFVYLGGLCGIFFIIEYYGFELDLLPFFLLLIIAPFTIYITNAVGFEIRLWITEIAAKMLQFVDADYRFSGNVIIKNRNKFYVEDVCLGLNMLSLSLFIDVIFIAFQQRFKKMNLSPIWVLITFGISTFWIIISNIVRLVLITIFQSPQDALSHDFIGILCFIMYVAFPMWFIIKKLPYKNSIKIISIKKQHPLLSKILLMLIFILFGGSFLFKEQTMNVKLQKNGVLSHKLITEESLGVLKYFDGDYLIYIKPPVHFYKSQHSPMVCWRGSGYTLQEQGQIEIDNVKLNYCELTKGDDKLYGTWWFDSGENKTVSQWKWRWNDFIGNEHYHVINVIAESKGEVEKKTTELLRINLFDENEKQ
ncbi:exosortase N [Flammeovirga sp. MY04]|uniref:exosortase N n=1 Tax=Flammeovirga sp. MY04 TaxID=1191459 RepID=UPI0008062EAB|nr:exosortase N [Flammeovirga sp. MY04]ANQ49737.1 exosortase N [Flammeovirga sp. MY04]